MSDEELEASLDQDIQGLVNTLSQGTKQQAPGAVDYSRITAPGILGARHQI
jgi:hypothetical protein